MPNVVGERIFTENAFKKRNTKTGAVAVAAALLFFCKCMHVTHKAGADFVAFYDCQSATIYGKMYMSIMRHYPQKRTEAKQ